MPDSNACPLFPPGLYCATKTVTSFPGDPPGLSHENCSRQVISIRIPARSHANARGMLATSSVSTMRFIAFSIGVIALLAAVYPIFPGFPDR